jgi:hypothetical protein
MEVSVGLRRPSAQSNKLSRVKVQEDSKRGNDREAARTKAQRGGIFYRKKGGEGDEHGKIPSLRAPIGPNSARTNPEPQLQDESSAAPRTARNETGSNKKKAKGHEIEKEANGSGQGKERTALRMAGRRGRRRRPRLRPVAGNRGASTGAVARGGVARVRPWVGFLDRFPEIQ